MFWFWVVSSLIAGGTIGLLVVGFWAATRLELRIPE